MGKKTISNTFTVNTIIDGESAPYYFQEWFAWSNDPSTSSVITPPTISGSWATSIPAQGSYAYLWRKSIRYVWNDSTRTYSGEAAQYFRMSGTNGTSINTRGQVASASQRGSGTATLTNGTTITLSNGDAVTQLDNGHLYQWVTEGGGVWLDLGQFKGDSGVTWYSHVAWATNVTVSGSTVTVTGFVETKSPNDTTHVWMGTYVDTNSGQDSSNASLYTWSYIKGVKGDNGQTIQEISIYRWDKMDPGIPSESVYPPTGWSTNMGSGIHKGDSFLLEGVEHSQKKVIRLCFETTKANATVTLMATSYSELDYDFLCMGLADSAFFEANNATRILHDATALQSYGYYVSGDGESITHTYTFASAGRHFICIAYVKDDEDSYSDDNGEVEVMAMDGVRNYTDLWMCSGTFVNNVLQGGWGSVVKINANDAQTANQNILRRTIFDNGVNAIRDAWESAYWDYISVSQSSTTDVDGHHSIIINAGYLSSGQYIDFGQNVIASLKPSTWYTLSFNYYATHAFETYLWNGTSSQSSPLNQSAGWYIDGAYYSNVPLDGYISWPANTNITRRHTVTFRTASSFPTSYLYLLFRTYHQAHTVGGVEQHDRAMTAICMPKLEYGQYATEYMPIDSDLRGRVGRFFYYGGDFNSSDSTTLFNVNDAQAPFFSHVESGQKRYHVYNPSDNPSGGQITMAAMWAESQGSWNNTPWDVMTNDFKYLITEALFTDFAKLGSFVINFDYFISQYGVVLYNNNGTIERTTIDATNYQTIIGGGLPYTHFDVNDPDCNTNPTSGHYKFKPTLYMNAKSGKASFGCGKTQFNEDGSGQLAGGNVSWDANGGTSFNGTVRASNFFRSMTFAYPTSNQGTTANYYGQNGEDWRFVQSNSGLKEHYDLNYPSSEAAIYNQLVDVYYPVGSYVDVNSIPEGLPQDDWYAQYDSGFKRCTGFADIVYCCNNGQGYFNPYDSSSVNNAKIYIPRPHDFTGKTIEIINGAYIVGSPTKIQLDIRCVDQSSCFTHGLGFSNGVAPLTPTESGFSLDNEDKMTLYSIGNYWLKLEYVDN